MIGVILGLHKNREKGDFVVLQRITGLEYPTVNIDKALTDHMRTGAYHHVWFQEVTLP